METEVALPPAEQAQASDPNVIDTTAVEIPEGEAKPEGEARPEKTPEQREIDRLRRGIDRRTKQLAEARAQIGLTRQPIADNNQQTADDSESLSLTRAELAKYVNAEALKLAPTLSKQALEVEQQSKIVKSLQASVGGQEKFIEMTNELAEVFDGSKQLAVLDADDPAALLKYLTDPENADEAEEIGRLSDIAAGKRLARIEAKLAALPKTPAKQVSKAPAPLEEIRGMGTAQNPPDPSNEKAWRQWRNEQERKGRA